MKKSKGISKSAAGLMLSRFLRSIAEEKTELIRDPDGGDKISTKAEALARLIWKHALGYSELTKAGLTVTYRPDKSMIAMLYNRLEGKIPDAPRNKANTQDVADKVSELGVQRINNV